MMPLKVSRSSLLGLFDLVSKCGEDLQPLLVAEPKINWNPWLGVHARDPAFQHKKMVH
jgi:hypothetical protein